MAYHSKGTRGAGLCPPEVLGGWEADDFAVELTPTDGGPAFWADLQPRRLPELQVFVAVPTRARLTLVARRDRAGPPSLESPAAHGKTAPVGRAIP